MGFRKQELIDVCVIRKGTVKLENVISKGIRWSSNRLKWIPENQPGVFVIFDEDDKTVRVGSHTNLLEILREEWWKKNYWVFSWFGCSSFEAAKKLGEEMERKTYDELWELD